MDGRPPDADHTLAQTLDDGATPWASLHTSSGTTRRALAQPARLPAMANHGDWQLSIYLAGLTGEVPQLPMTYAELERRAEEVMPPEIWSYVAGGAGDEHTQRANVAAFERWGLDASGARRRRRARPLRGAVRHAAADAAAARTGRRHRALRPRRPRRPADGAGRRRQRRADGGLDVDGGPDGGRRGCAGRRRRVVPVVPAERPRT